VRVLFDALSLGSRESGTRTRVLGLSPQLVSLGVDVSVLVGPELGAEAEAQLSGVNIVREARPPGGPIGRVLRGRRILDRVRRSVRPDWMVSECLPWPEGQGVVGVVHDLRWRHDRGVAARLRRRALVRGCGTARRIHVVSAATATTLAAVLPDVPRHVRIVPNGVDQSRFQPGPVDRDLGYLARRDLRPGYLLCVGHLEERKAPDMAIRVRRELARRGLDIPVVFVGRGDILPEESLCALKADFPRQDLGRVLRDVGAEELPALYRGASVVIAPATEEGFGMVPLEALACGTPVVASDIPAHREVVGDAALLCRAGDVTEFVSAVLPIVEFGQDRERFLAQGPEQAARWTWKAAAAAFVDDLTRAE